MDGKLLAEGAGVSQKEAQIAAAINARNSALVYKGSP